MSIIGCHGLCSQGPLAVVSDGDTYYPRLKLKDVKTVVEEHLTGGQVVEKLLYVDPATGERIACARDIPFYKAQHRIALRDVGVINPESLDEYLARGGYEAARKALATMKPEEIIEEILASGLRGRGGAGFPTGTKWKFAAASPGDTKYIICNGDEGDPGAFMDASIMDGDPHAVLEGMLIGSYAIGAHEGYIYVRAEYPLAVKRLRMAIAAAEERGLLGDDALGSGWGFHLKIKEGAGAFVCGEETALIASIEGKRGMPRTRPPFPAASGLWGKPTNINNVETWANIPWIVANGAAAYAAYGNDTCKGTKAFSLAGKIVNGGLAEVPMGSTLRHVIFDVGGGIKDGKKFKAVQLGGPSGGCVPASLLDTPVDYESLAATGAIVGSGGMVVADDSTCMVDLAKYFLQFTQNESCGKCVPCRIGTKRMLEILERITEGEGRGGRHRAPREHGPQHQEDEPLRPRPDGAQPGAHHDPLLPRGVPGAHRRPALPGAVLRGAHRLRGRPGGLHRLHAVRQEVPRRRGHRHQEGAAHHRPGALHPLRRLPRRLQVRRGQGRQRPRGDRRGGARAAHLSVRDSQPRGAGDAACGVAGPSSFVRLCPCLAARLARIVRCVTNQVVPGSRPRGGGTGTAAVLSTTDRGTPPGVGRTSAN